MAKQLRPFREGTRQRRQFISAPSYSASATLTTELPRVGYLNRLVVAFAGTITTTAAGALTDSGPWNLVNRFRVNTNIGSTQLVDVSGFGLFIAQRFQNEAQSFDKAGVGDTVPSADIFAAAVASGANTWALPYIIPIGANVADEFEFGMINLQSEQTRVTLDIVCGAVSDPNTNSNTITGTFSIWYEYYEVPDPRVFAQPPLTITRLVEESQTVSATGDNPYTIPRQGVLMQAAGILRLNSLRSDGFSQTKVRFNKTDIAYTHDRVLNRILDRTTQILNPVTGVVYEDFWYAQGLIGQGDARDMIDLEELSTVEIICNITTAPSGTSTYNVVRRIAQRLVK